MRKKAKTSGFNPDEIIADMKVELDARCKTLELHTEHLADTLKNAFMVEFTRIPKKIREMPLKKFFEEFDGSMEVVLEHDKRQCFAEASSAIPQVPTSASYEQEGAALRYCRARKTPRVQDRRRLRRRQTTSRESFGEKRFQAPRLRSAPICPTPSVRMPRKVKASSLLEALPRKLQHPPRGSTRQGICDQGADDRRRAELGA